MNHRAALRGARAAAVFLTSVPVGGFPFNREEAAWASAWFPAVGTGIGVALAAVWRLFAFLDPLPDALLTLTVGLLLTGAFHEDGLADTADALGGGVDRDHALRILKDSRVGAYGAVALVASFTVRGALLASVPGLAASALMASQCVSRLAPVWLLAALPYLTPESESKSRPVARAARAQVIVATLWTMGVLLTLAAAGLATGVRLAGVAVMALAVTYGCGALYRRRLGGITGDLLGAAQQVVEIGTLIVLAAR